MTLSLDWATNVNYSTGPDSGTPTKVDPASEANGFIRDTVAAPQHVNYLFSQILEYLHRAEDSPEIFAEVKDDFMPGAYDEPNGLLHTDRTWRVTQNASATQGPSTGFGNNPGVHFATIPATQSYELHLGEELIAGLARWGDIECATIVLGLFSTNYTGSELFVGLATTLSDGGLGDDAVGLWFRKATSNNWQIRHKVGGADDATDSLVPMVTDEFVVLKLTRISSTAVQVRLNGTLVATLTDGSTAPSDNTWLNVGLVAQAGPSAGFTFYWDLVHVRWATSNRQS